MPRGFSFIEVIVSIAIIGTLLFALQATLRATPLIRSAKDQDLALKVATSEIERLRSAGYGALPASGTFTDSLLATLPSGAGTLTLTTANAKTKQVVVVVSWREAGNATTSSVALTTLITQVGGLQ